MKTLWLLRHAESKANAGQYWAHGPAEIPLSSLGQAHAVTLAASWMLPPPDILIASPYRRSMETAAPLADRLDLKPVILPVQEFTYYDYRLTEEQYAQRHLLGADYWHNCDVLEKGGGQWAENFLQFMQRVRAFQAWLDDTSFATCLCVSHGWFMTAFDLVAEGADDLNKPQDLMALIHVRQHTRPPGNLELIRYEHLGDTRGWRRVDHTQPAFPGRGVSTGDAP